MFYRLFKRDSEGGSSPMVAEIGEDRYCPACHKPYSDWVTLKKHLQKAVNEGDTLHLEVVELEGWDEVLKAPIVKGLLVIDDEHLA